MLPPAFEAPVVTTATTGEPTWSKAKPARAPRWRLLRAMRTRRGGGSLAKDRATPARSEDWRNLCSARNRANHRATWGPQLSLAEIGKSWNLANHADYGGSSSTVW